MGSNANCSNMATIIYETDIVLVINLIREYERCGSTLYCYITKLELNSPRVEIKVFHKGGFISIIGVENTPNIVEAGNYRFYYKPSKNESLFVLEEYNPNSKL